MYLELDFRIMDNSLINIWELAFFFFKKKSNYMKSRQKKGETEKDLPSSRSFSKWPQNQALGKADVRSQELHGGPPYGQKNLRYLDHPLLHPKKATSGPEPAPRGDSTCSVINTYLYMAPYFVMWFFSIKILFTIQSTCLA